MATSRDKMIKLLEDKYPKLFISTTERFNGSTGGIWSSGECGLQAKDGFRLFNYYADVSGRYEFGVHKEIRTLLSKHGWYADWYDAGTIMIYEE